MNSWVDRRVDTEISRVPARLFGLLALALFLRLSFPDADPVPMDFSLSAFGDLGYYAMNARNAALFGVWTESRWFTLPLMPAWVIPLAGWFSAFGASLLSLRVFCVLCHIIGAACSVEATRRIWGGRVAVWAAFFWAVDWVSIAGSRNGWIENGMVGYIGMAFLAATASRGVAGLFLTGLLLGLLVAAKPFTIVAAGASALLLSWERPFRISRMIAVLLGIVAIAIPYLLVLKGAEALFPEIMTNTYAGTFAGRGTIDPAYIVERLFRAQEVFATPFFARTAIAWASAVLGVFFLLAERRERSAGERFLFGIFAGLAVLYIYMDYRSIRYYLLAMPVLFPLAGFALARLTDFSFPIESAAREKIARFLGAACIAYAGTWAVAVSGLDRSLSSFQWHALAFPLAAGLYCLWPAVVSRLSRVPAGVLAAMIVVLPALQFAEWIPRKTTELSEATDELARAHPPARVCGWFAPVLVMGTPHLALWDWGPESDDADRYRRLYGADYWWTIAERPEPARIGDLVCSRPFLLFGPGRNIFVYRLR